MQCHVKRARFSQTRYAYNAPWQDESRELHFCSDDCGDSYMYEKPWVYFWCDRCDREISEQHPLNGWQIQYRWVDEEQVCLRCYEKRLLDEGIGFERDKLERGAIPGMFFSHRNTEAREAGYEEIPEFENYHVDTEERGEAFRRKALELLDRGKKVVIGYESLAYGGGEVCDADGEGLNPSNSKATGVNILLVRMSNCTVIKRNERLSALANPS
jgi:hypothetical protein